MRRFSTIFGLVLLGIFQSLGQAQTGRQPSTPAECLKAVQDYPQELRQAARASGQTLSPNEIRNKKIALAKECAARFSVESVTIEELNTLAQLYFEAEQLEMARAAINRHLAMPEISEAERAATLELAIKLSFLTPYTKVTKDHVALAEKYLTQLNGLSDAVLLNKVKAYDKIGGYYGWADVDEKITEYVNKVLTLSKRLDPDERKAIGRELIGSYIDLARVYANREEIDQALAALRKGLDELADIPTAKETINNAIQSYLLVGQPAAPIEAEHWLNAEAGTKRVDLGGQVTLLQFAAHWCAPCAKSYPAMLGFHEQFAKDGLRVMFVTKTYGYFGEQFRLKPEEELAANREYYVEHHGLPFKIAMAEWKMDTSREANSASRHEANEARYSVSGYPTIIVIDKQGVIRLKMIGWDPTNESRLARLIEKLLAEPVPKDKS